MAEVSMFQVKIARAELPLLAILAWNEDDEAYTEGAIVQPGGDASSYFWTAVASRTSGQRAVMREIVLERLRSYAATQIPAGAWRPLEIEFDPIEALDQLTARIALKHYPALQKAKGLFRSPEVWSAFDAISRVNFVDVAP